MERARVSKKFSFAAAHFLPGYKGKCANMHGHTWEVEVTVEGPVDPETGMVIDFVALKELVEPLIERLDHKLLNDIAGLEMPTAENIALWFRNQWYFEPSGLKSIKVWESPTSCAEVLCD